ncbi:MAG: hypothetical protein H6937_02410 [Burkholderiales bacterium]|nr:hypothetical protein [Burkholderiales bacterium]
MAITMTDAHRKRMIDQAYTGVMNLQESVLRNALTHKQWAIDQIYTLPELQQRINDTLAAYESIRAQLRNFRDVVIPADPGFLTVGDQLALTLQSVGVIGTEVADEIDAFSVMPRTSYAEIISACDYLIANVDPLPSVWD